VAPSRSATRRRGRGSCSSSSRSSAGTEPALIREPSSSACSAGEVACTARAVRPPDSSPSRATTTSAPATSAARSTICASASSSPAAPLVSLTTAILAPFGAKYGDKPDRVGRQGL